MYLLIGLTSCSDDDSGSGNANAGTFTVEGVTYTPASVDGIRYGSRDNSGTTYSIYVVLTASQPEIALLTIGLVTSEEDQIPSGTYSLPDSIDTINVLSGENLDETEFSNGTVTVENNGGNNYTITLTSTENVSVSWSGDIKFTLLHLPCN